MKAAAVKRGATFRYELDEAARVLFAIDRSEPGRRVGRKCRKPTRASRGKPGCRRFVRVGRFAVGSAAGLTVKRFSGRVGRVALRVGAYRATLTATDAAGNASLPRRLSFHVVAAR